MKLRNYSIRTQGGFVPPRRKTPPFVAAPSPCPVDDGRNALMVGEGNMNGAVHSNDERLRSIDRPQPGPPCKLRAASKPGRRHLEDVVIRHPRRFVSAPLVSPSLGVLLALQLFGATSTQTAAQVPVNDPAPAACGTTPNRTCLLEEAFASALTIETGLDRYTALRAVATAQQQARQSAASAASLAAAIAALDDAGSAARSRAMNDALGGSMAFRSISLAQSELGLTAESRASLAEALRAAQSAKGYNAGLALRTVGEAQAQAGLKAEAAVSFAQALEAMRSLGDTSLRASEPRRVAEAQLKASMPDAAAALNQALAAAADIRDERVRVEALASIAETLVKAGLTEEAGRTFAQASQLANAIRHQPTGNGALCFTALKAAEAGMHDFAARTLEQALSVALAITDRLQRFDALRRTGDAYVRIGSNTEAASVLAQALEATNGTNQVYEILTIADAQVKMGALDDALATLRRAPATPSQIEGPFYAPSPEGAEAAASENLGAYHQRRASIYSSIAKAQALRGLQQDAEATFAEGLRIARSIKPVARRANALFTVAVAQSVAGASAPADVLAEAATAAVETTRNIEATMNSSVRDTALNHAAQALVAVGRAQTGAQATTEALGTLDQATRAARSLIDRAFRNDALSAVANAYASARQFNLASQIARSIDHPSQRATTLLSIAQAMPN
jgi:tetratricopeptide (TPR) repeat protein